MCCPSGCGRLCCWGRSRGCVTARSAGEHVFVTEWGDQLAPWTLQRAIRTARAKVPGLPLDFRFHDLRHFAATMAAISGATTKELMQFAGHSDIHVAMRYQEAVNDRKKDLAKRMAALAQPAVEE